MKIKLISLFFTIISINTFAQHGFLTENHSYQIDGNNLCIYLEAEFALGFGLCDYLDTCLMDMNNDTISINAIYDISGFNPLSGCIDYDTINYNIPSGNYTLVINSTIIFVDSVNNVDTALVSSQLFPNIALSVKNEFTSIITIYPNPITDVLQIKTIKDIQIETIEIYDIKGKKVQAFNKNERMLNISEVHTGTYFLKLLTKQGVLTKKIIIE